MTTTETSPKTSINGKIVRSKIRAKAIVVHDISDELDQAVRWLAHEANQAVHLIDGDREDTHELISDLEAARTMIARIQAKAGTIARRTKND